MTLSALATMAALGALAWWRVERAQARQLESRRAAITRELRDTRVEVERWLQQRDDEARLAAELAQPTLEVARLTGLGARAGASADLALRELREAMEAMRHHAGWTALWVYDDAGAIVASTSTDAPSAGEYAAVQRALEGALGQSAALLPLQHAADGALIASWIVPISMTDGTCGAILLRADPSNILVLPKQNGTVSRTDVAAVVDGKYVIVSPRRPVDSLPRVLPREKAPAFARAALAGQELFGVFEAVHGIPVYAGAVTVGTSGWIVTRQTDFRAGRSYVIADLRHELAMFSAAMFPVLLVGGLAVRRLRVTRMREMRRSEASYRSFVEHSPFGIYRSTADGQFSTVNWAMVGILGYDSREELLALRDMSRDVYVDAGERARITAEQVTGSRVPPREVRWRRKDGRVITVRLSCRPLRDDAGMLTGWEGFVEDVTPLREAESALRRAETLASMGQLLSGVAHELSNPITAILHFSAELERAVLAAEDVESVALIREQALRCREIVRDLLAMARRREAAREVIDLGVLTERAVLALRPRLQEQRVRVEVRIPESAACVVADRIGLEQVITNLVTNGADAAGDGGTITVEVARIGSECLIRVSDDGPGIAPDVLPHLFEPFFTTKPEGRGTGLGLAVSLGIVEQHGGRLVAENRTDGRGARFVVTLPATALRPSPSHGTTPPRGSGAIPAIDTVEGASAASRPRVLVVDDEAPVRAALRRTLELRGWRADDAGSGAEAMQRFAEQHAAGAPYALVLSDYRLSDMTGLALLERMAVQQPGIAERFVLCTGDPMALEGATSTRVRCRVIEKPFDFEALVRLIDELRPRAEPAAALRV